MKLITDESRLTVETVRESHSDKSTTSTTTSTGKGESVILDRFHGGIFPSVISFTPFHTVMISKPGLPFLYMSPILLGNIDVPNLMTSAIISLRRS